MDLRIVRLWIVLVAAFGARMVAAEVASVGASLGARQPQVAIDGASHIHLTFGAENKIFYTHSTDEGASYQNPIEIAKLPTLALGMRRGPRISAGNGFVIVTAIGGQRGGGRDGDLMAWRSTDVGKSWQGPVRVNDAASSAREGLHAMAATDGGDVHCVWLDLRSKGTKLFGAHSDDGGRTWGPNTPIYESPDGSICECCHPSVAFGNQGKLHVMWRNSIGGIRDMFMASSSDLGKTFSAARKLGQGTWKLDACPMDGGMLSANAHGNLATIWRRDKQVLLTASDERTERELGTGQQPWVALDHRGAFAVWLSQRPGDLHVSLPGKRPAKLTSQARDPVIAAAPSGYGPVVVAWEAEENGRPLIRVTTIVHKERP